MLRSMTWKQLAGWKAYDDLEPFGPQREDWRAASLVSTLANIYRDRKKRRQPWTVKDFVEFVIPPRESLEEGGTASTPPAEKKPRQSWREMKFVAQMMTAMANSKPRRGRHARNS